MRKISIMLLGVALSGAHGDAQQKTKTPDSTSTMEFERLPNNTPTVFQYYGQYYSDGAARVEHPYLKFYQDNTKSDDQVRTYIINTSSEWSCGIQNAYPTAGDAWSVTIGCIRTLDAHTK